MDEILKGALLEIKERHGLNAYDEATTRYVIIDRILDILGWKIHDPTDVRVEYPVDRQTSEKIDYALAPNTPHMLFIEAKAVNKDLETHEEQLCNYCFKNGVKLGVLTNGISWWFYLPRADGSWYERKFYSINIIQQDTNMVVSKFIEFLAKQNVLNDKANENAEKTHASKQKNQIIKKTLPEAWNRLVSSEDEKFLDMLNDMLEKISGYRAEPKEIAEFLANNQKIILNPEDAQIRTSKRTLESEINNSHQNGTTKHYFGGGYTGKTLTGVFINNKKYGCSSWIELLLIVCNEVSIMRKNDFEKVLSLRGRKRPYFSRNPNEMHTPSRQPIKNTGIYVETNLSANSIVRLSNDVLSLFELPEVKPETL